jgi:uncharacterized membrane protein AbrB (regulator of aidB expression)
LRWTPKLVCSVVGISVASPLAANQLHPVDAKLPLLLVVVKLLLLLLAVAKPPLAASNHLLAAT